MSDKTEDTETLDKIAINKICDVFSMDEALEIFNERVEAHVSKSILEVLDNIKEPTIQDVFPERPYDGTNTYEDMLQVVKYYNSAIEQERNKLGGKK